jgi:hypothetical protein
MLFDLFFIALCTFTNMKFFASVLVGSLHHKHIMEAGALARKLRKVRKIVFTPLVLTVFGSYRLCVLVARGLAQTICCLISTLRLCPSIWSTWTVRSC